MPFLVAAMDWRGTGEWTPARVLAAPEVAHYANGWMRRGDAGVVAVLEGDAVGAAWWRTFPATDPGYGFVAADVPEVGLAVLGQHRGHGIGAALLDVLIASAGGAGLPGLSLSVEDGNDAARGLYERRGFRVEGRNGGSDTLLLRL